MALSILLAFRRIATLVVLTATILTSTSALAGTTSGLILGALLFGGRSQTTIVQQMPESHGDGLYEEYKHNQSLIAKGVDGSQALKLRNTQIENILVQQARDEYIDAFNVNLKPVATKEVQRDAVPDDARNFIKRVGSLSFGPAETTNLKRLSYVIDFDGPEPISKFSVSLNGKKLHPVNGKYQFDYTQQYGENRLVLGFQSIVYKDLAFTVDESFKIQSPSDIVAKRNSPDEVFTDMSAALPLGLAVLGFGLLLKSRKV